MVDFERLITRESGYSAVKHLYTAAIHPYTAHKLSGRIVAVHVHANHTDPIVAEATHAEAAGAVAKHAVVGVADASHAEDAGAHANHAAPGVADAIHAGGAVAG